MNVSWFLLIAVPLMAIIFMVIGAIILLLKNPKTRPWGIALLVAPFCGFLLLFVGFLSFRFVDISPLPTAPELPVTVRQECGDRSRPETAVESRPSGSTIKTEPRSLGSGASESSSRKKNTKPLPDERGSDKDESETNNKRPDWIDTPPGKVDKTYHRVLVIGPYSTRLECDQKMPSELRRAVKDYCHLYLGNYPSRRWPVRLSDDYIHEHVVKGTWEETKDTSVGPMTQLHVLLAFDQKTNNLIEHKLNEQRRKSQRGERITWAVVALGLALAALLIAYMVLKFDLIQKLNANRWIAIQVLVIGLFLVLVIGTLDLCSHVDHKLCGLKNGSMRWHKPHDQWQLSMDQARRQYDQLVLGLYLILPLAGATMGYLSWKKKTRIVGIAGAVSVLVVIIGSILILCV